jgi:protein-tyrosine phosphatase
MHLHLGGARNFRSLEGIATADGRRLANHTLLRSDQLHAIDEDDWKVLGQLGVRAVCDLRSDYERARHPNRLPPGLRQLAMPVIVDIRSDPQFAALLREAPNAAGATRTMKAMYRRLPAALAPHLPSLFALFTTGESPVLVHCAAGKDRTGFAVAVVLHALGVAPEDIMEDYLRSSPARRSFDAEHQQRLDRMTREAVGETCTPEMVQVLLDARPEFLHAAFEAVRESCGSMDRYLAVAAGQDTHALARLRDALLA